VKDLGQTIAAFRQALSSPIYDPQPLAQKLYHMLFLNPQLKGPTLAEDLQAYLRDQKDKTLMWSLDGVLRYVPMAALHDGEQYLVERYRNVVFTTASLAGLTHPVSRDWKALGLGVSKSYPGFEAPVGRASELAAARPRLRQQEMPGVLPGTTKIDDQFTERALMDSLREGFRWSNIASHFSYQPRIPRSLFFCLATAPILKPQSSRTARTSLKRPNC
jgi:CHAT domain-containing protein